MAAQCLARLKRPDDIEPVTVLKSTYMDDSLNSGENGEQGVDLYHQLKAVGKGRHACDKMGFQLKKGL